MASALLHPLSEDVQTLETLCPIPLHGRCSRAEAAHTLGASNLPVEESEQPQVAALQAGVCSAGATTSQGCSQTGWRGRQEGLSDSWTSLTTTSGLFPACNPLQEQLAMSLQSDAMPHLQSVCASMRTPAVRTSWQRTTPKGCCIYY